MIATKNIDIISSLCPDDQVILISLAKTMLKNRSQKTAAQEKFAEMKKKYASTKYTMEEIDAIIHEEVDECR